MSELGSLDLARDGDRAVARLSGEIDMSNAQEFGARIRAGLDGAAVLVVDLTEVTYFDSAGVRLLDELGDVGALRVVAPVGSRARTTLRICAFPPELIAESLGDVPG